eukprot:scaffold9161_cov263-Amphora_coffeaeformis.AAC.1
MPSSSSSSSSSSVVSAGAKGTAITVLATTASVTAVVWTLRYLQGRARLRAETSVEKVKAALPQNKPLRELRVKGVERNSNEWLKIYMDRIDIENSEVRERIVCAAIKRASKWMTLSREDATPLHGQVGGAAMHKRPLLTLEPDY